MNNLRKKDSSFLSFLSFLMRDGAPRQRPSQWAMRPLRPRHRTSACGQFAGTSSASLNGLVIALVR